MINRRLVFFVVLPLIVATAAFADTHYVSLNGSNSSPYTNWAMAATSLTTGLVDPLPDGDVILVSNGTFNISAVILTRNNKSVTITGVYGAAQTIFNGGGGVFSALSSYTVVTTTVSGITFTNFGSVAISAGGGATWRIANCVIAGNRYSDSVNAGGGGLIIGGIMYLSGCVIAGNTANKGGGGICVSSGALYATNCVIRGNMATNVSAYAGAGVKVSGALCVLDNCEISSNLTSGGYGGGVYTDTAITMNNCRVLGHTNAGWGGGVYVGAPNSTVQYCTIAGNQAGNVGGIYMDGTNNAVRNCSIIGNQASTSLWLSVGGVYLLKGAAFDNCLVANNTSAGAGGVRLDGGGVMRNCTVVSNGAYYSYPGGATVSTAINSIVYFNLPAPGSIYSNFYADSSGTWSNCCAAPNPTNYSAKAVNCITTNPMLVNLPADCHLLRGSPCINTGLNQDWMTNAVDLDGRPRIRERTVDMGAYESFPKGVVLMLQ